jgi:hypothetical protein
VRLDLVYGSAVWNAPTKVNCHFVAERLSRDVPVVFVESVGARAPRPHDWRRAVARLARSMRPLRRVGERLWVFSPLPLPAFRGRGARLGSATVGIQLRAMLRLLGWRVDVGWIFHPMGLGTARAAAPRATVYYCVDDYLANPGVDREALALMETELARAADVTVVTGEPLAPRFRGLARRVEVLPNVADTELFARGAAGVTHPVLAALDATPGPRVGYLGNLAAYKIDLDLVDGIARRRPDWSVTLVGPRDLGDTAGAVGRRRFPPNVRLLGPVPHALAPAVIDRFDVALLPAAAHDVMKASFPLKFFEYLLRGKPVVSSPLPALEPYREWYDAAETAGEFVKAIEDALAGDGPSRAEGRRRFAAGFGWVERGRQLLALRAELLGVSDRGGTDLSRHHTGRAVLGGEPRAPRRGPRTPVAGR